MFKYKNYFFENENAIHTQSYLLPHILNYIKENNPVSVLDVGCGNGSISNELIKQGYDIYGIDASESGISIANTVTPNRFFVCDFDTMQLPVQLPIKKFDLIIATEVIEHIYSPSSFMTFCKSVLTSDGKILLSTPYHGYLKNLLLSLSGNMDAHFTVLWEGGHIKFWSKKTLSTLLHNHSFNNINFIGCGRIPFFWKSMIMTAQLKS